MTSSQSLKPNLNIDAVLCGGIYQDGDTFVPSTFEHSDEFGMLGGEMRVIAAVARAQKGLSKQVLFVGGKSEKGAASRGGDHVPAPHPAAVYAGYFTRMFVACGEATESHPTIKTTLIDSKSSNTTADLQYSLQSAGREGWHDMAIISNEYHIPRVTALCAIIKEKMRINDMQISFLAAEDIVRAANPGLYDEVIEAAYASAAGQLRLESEAQGLADIKAGRYTFSEVRALKPRS